MAILAILINRTETIEAYQNVHARIGDNGDVPPPGLIFQVAGPAAPGYQVITVWDSLASYARFRDERLRPALEAAGVSPGNITTTTFEVTNYLVGAVSLPQQATANA